MNPIIFESINKNTYFYDNSTRLILPLDEDIVHKITKVDSINTIKKIIKSEYNQYNLFEDKGNDIFQGQKDTIENYKDIIMQNGLNQLTLIVTDACNLRCKYCIYSQEYDYTRAHGHNLMSWDIAKKAIDYYFNFNLKSLEYNPKITPTIGFYGGEPLLNIDVIKKSIEYIDLNYKYKFCDIQYTITTNGTLLEENVIDFFFKNNVFILVSFDGSQYDQDRNRVYTNGDGTYTKVIKTILMLEKKAQEYLNLNENHLGYSLLMVYDNNTEFLKTQEFCKKYPDIAKKFIRITKVNGKDTDYYKGSDSTHINHQIKEMVFEYLEDVKEDKSIDFKIKFLAYHSIVLSVLNNVSYTQNYLRGSCIPGTKLAVDISGDFYICEKVDYQNCIGDVFNGINWKKGKKYLKKYLNVVNQKCKECNYYNLCNLCFAQCADGKGEFAIKDDLCELSKQNIRNALFLYVSELENKEMPRRGENRR